MRSARALVDERMHLAHHVLLEHLQTIRRCRVPRSKQASKQAK
jgi:hypothetical protein